MDNNNSQQELFKELFTKYGSYHEDFNSKTINISVQHPNGIHTEEDAIRWFKHTEEDIQRLENHIKMLKAYQTALTDRYNYIVTCAYKTKYKFKRHKNYNGKVFYYIIKYQVNLDDGHEQEQERVTFEGKQRADAIKQFNKLQELNANCYFEMDIDKPKWER